MTSVLSDTCFPSEISHRPMISADVLDYWGRPNCRKNETIRNMPAANTCAFNEHTGGEQNNGNTKKLRNVICVGYIEITSVANTESSSSVCLHSVVLV
jgi:hypothetical protein